jgi:peptidoglycan/xylan/chitin deacetylase (PgdA/CDA1 family)
VIAGDSTTELAADVRRSVHQTRWPWSGWPWLRRRETRGLPCRSKDRQLGRDEKDLNMTHPRRHRLVVVGSCGLLALVVAAACGTANPGGRTPSPVPPTLSVPPPSAASPSPTSSPSSSPSPSLQITAPPATPVPLAGSLPLVDSCNPASVPGAIPVTAPASGKDSSFALHVPILMYHRIVPFAQAGNSNRGLVVPPSTFAAQLTGLESAGWHTITMATLANDLQAHVKPPAKTFVITIDDGWDDGYTYALPILQSQGFVATYFVIAGRIDESGFLTSGHLQALVAAGEEIGDHTMDHEDLAEQPATRLPYEIDAAAARIAQVTGRWPESFAYPSGVVDNRVAAAVAACGELRIAVTEEPVAPEAPGATNPPVGMPVALETWADRFVVPRVRITPNTKPAYLESDLRILEAG